MLTTVLEFVLAKTDSGLLLLLVVSARSHLELASEDSAEFSAKLGMSSSTISVPLKLLLESDPLSLEETGGVDLSFILVCSPFSSSSDCIISAVSAGCFCSDSV